MPRKRRLLVLKLISHQSYKNILSNRSEITVWITEESTRLLNLKSNYTDFGTIKKLKNKIMSIFTWIAGLFSKIDRLIRKLQPKTALALAISTNLKAFLASPTADIAVMLIPTDWDKLAQQEALKAMDYAIPLLQAENKCQTDVDCWAKEIATWPAPLQNSAVMKLASLLLGYYDEFKQAEHLYDTVIQNTIAGTK